MNVRIEQSWKQQLQEEFDKPYFEKLVTFVKDEYKRAHVLPLGHQIFHIFNSIKTWENQFLLPVTWIAGLPKAYSR